MSSWHEWTREIMASIIGVSDDDLQRVAKLILASDLVVTAGNGGSAALASHMAQAIAKPDYAAGGGRASVCLTDGIPTLTAHTNDGGWPSALGESAKPFFDLDGCGARLVLVAISSSGRSENVCRLARLAVERKVPVIALTGFDGEPLKSLATISIHISSRDYEVIEPVHDALIHRIQFHVRDSAS